jgi:hypothetical protein
LANGQKKGEKFDENVTVGELFAWLREKAETCEVKLVIPGIRPITLTEEQSDKRLTECGVKERRCLLKVEPL